VFDASRGSKGFYLASDLISISSNLDSGNLGAERPNVAAAIARLVHDDR
jgi:hypothetical protein